MLSMSEIPLKLSQGGEHRLLTAFEGTVQAGPSGHQCETSAQFEYNIDMRQVNFRVKSGNQP